MKKIYIPLLLAVLTACQEGNITPEAQVVSDEMSFDVLAPGLQTKVANDVFEMSDVIGLYVTDYVDDMTPMPLQLSGNRANNLTVTYDGSAWNPEQTVFWGSGKSDVYAYYPVLETVDDVNDQYFELAVDQTKEGYEASDFLWAKAEGVQQQDGVVNLAMQHIMSNLTVKLVAGESYIGSLPEDATIHLHSTVTGARINLENGAVAKDPYCGAKSIKMKNLGLRTFADGEKAVVYEAIVLPQMLESSVPLLEINSKSVSYLLEDSFNFRPGTAYTYTVTLNTSTSAIKVEIGCELEDWNSVGGGESGEGGEIGDGDGGEGGSGSPEEDDTKYIDLSAAGTANCYLVQGTGDYKFKAVIGNTDATVGNVKSVEVLWESFGTDEMPNVGDLIASASYKDGYIRFTTPESFRDGNAVIVAKNSKGIILWSWHIWCAEEGWQEQVYYNNAGTMMDRNLGATSATPGDVGTLGLLYQWGRKDPFLGSSSVSSSVVAKSTGTWNTTSGGSVVLCETNPMTFYTSYMPDGSWGPEKTAYDPCPIGWKVPDGGEEGVWAKATGKQENFTMSSLKADKGINLSGLAGADEVIYYPCSGFLGDSSGSLTLVGSNGGYWSCSPNPSNTSRANVLTVNYSGSVYPVSNSIRSGGYAVRCLKE